MEELQLVKNNKVKINTLIEKIKSTENKEKQLELYQNILNIDNTKGEIVMDYLLLLKQIRKLEDNDPNPLIEIMKFKNHFSPNKFNEHFSFIEKKKNSSIEKLILIIKEILSRDWIKASIKEKNEIFKFFNKAMENDDDEIKNTSIITWENTELYIYHLYKEFLSQIRKKITYYESSNNINFKEIKSDKIKNCYELLKSLEDTLNEPNHPETYKINIKKNIDKVKKNIKLYALLEGNFFKKYLTNLNEFLSGINETYVQMLSQIKFDKKDDKDIFEYFMFFITNYNFENLTTIICNAWKKTFEDSGIDLKNKLIQYYKQQSPPMNFTFMENDLLKVEAKNFETIEINNIDDYDLVNLFDDIYKNKQFDEIQCMKYVKKNKINEHLYINKIREKWISFNISVFNSMTVMSLFKTLFVSQDYSILDENELYIILKNIKYYIFKTNFAGLTKRKTLSIYEYANLSEFSRDEFSNKDILKLVFLAFNLITNKHEILGHLNISYQIYSSNNENKKIYKSPEIAKEISSDYAKERGGKESGENIEIKLFGRVITYLTLKEALFILDLTNYLTNDYNSFRKKFENCNNNKIYIDDAFKCILENSFQINPDNIMKAENKIYRFDNDLIKKYSYNKIYTINRRHPKGYNIDGCKKEDFKEIKILANIIDDFDENFFDDMKCKK